MNQRRRSSFTSNPVLIGATTVLVIFVAVFLSYNANNGLPFVPTYEIKAELPSGANLVAGNDVRIGGTRVGAVSEIKPKRLAEGKVIAVVTMKLQQDVKPLPADSTVLVRPRSALGLKYVEIQRGKSAKGLRAGATLPLSQATPEPVELDDFLNTFDAKTRANGQVGLKEYGDIFAGRGEALNTALGELPPLLTDALPVLRNLRAPSTGLEFTIVSLERVARIVAPVAETQAELFRNLDTTFTALQGVRPQIKESITTGKPALDAVTRDLPIVRPVLANAAGLFADLRPGVRSLRTSAPILTAALVTGTPVLRRSPQLSRRLASLLSTLATFSKSPLVNAGLDRLRDTAQTTKPLLDYIAPTQTKCNYVALWFRNVASLLSEGDPNGTWQRFIIIANAQGQNAEGGPSSDSANGPGANYLHVNPYPNTGASGQPQECEAGNEKYLQGQQVIGNVPGNQGTKVDGTP